MKNDRKNLGDEVVRSLTEMNIPATPEYYKVWFSHLGENNSKLSDEIQERLNSEQGIDEFFLQDIHERYFELAHPTKQIEHFAVEILKETNALQRLSRALGSNTKQLTSDLAGVSESAAGGSLANADGSDGTRILNSLIEIAHQAVERNQDLEKDLAKASETIEKLQTSVETIAKDAKTDYLTSLNNRRYFDCILPQLVDATRSDNEPLCMIVADIDHFKSFNDQWGHAVGDQILKLISNILRSNVKGQDLLARYGGEEFVIALPNTSLADAEVLAEQIRVAVSKRKLVNRATNQSIGRVTMSFGVAEMTDDWSCEDLYRHADTALYRAKEFGRNQVIAARQDSLDS